MLGLVVLDVYGVIAVKLRAQNEVPLIDFIVFPFEFADAADHDRRSEGDSIEVEPTGTVN